MKRGKRKINEVFRDCFYRMLNITPKHNLEEYFKLIGIKNSEGKYPIQKKIVDGEKGDLYFIKIPEGLNFEDFIKHQVVLEKFYSSSVDMNWDGEFLTIEMYSNKDKYNLENFFMNVGLKNKSNHHPKQIKTVEDQINNGKRKNTCYMSFPDGLVIDDFMQYKSQLENKFNSKVDIDYVEGYVKIDFIEK